MTETQEAEQLAYELLEMALCHYLYETGSHKAALMAAGRALANLELKECLGDGVSIENDIYSLAPLMGMSEKIITDSVNETINALTLPKGEMLCR